MSTKALQCALGMICAVGVALVGIGWRVDRQPRKAAPERVFCSIAELEKYHPAWGQFVQVNSLVAPRSKADGGSDSAALSDETIAIRDQAPSVRSATRAELQACLEQKAEEELAGISGQLDVSVHRQFVEKRRELEVQMAAKDAEDKRNSDQSLAKALRELDESHKDNRIAVAIKLAALKAQLSAKGVVQESIKRAIVAKEQELNGLSSEEDALKAEAEMQLDSAKSERRRLSEKSLAELESAETARISKLIASRRERLHKELIGNSLVASSMPLQTGSGIVSFRAGVNGNAAKVKAAAKSGYTYAASTSGASLLKIRKDLQSRMNTELKAVVLRIARENGYQVTFESDKKSRDMTSWFRQRLPYITARRSG